MRAPTFSVIVPTYRRPQKLAECLQSLARQTYAAQKFEVIVVDDAGTRAELEPVVAASGLSECRLLSQYRRGPAVARNAGAAAARGRLIAFTDDDCRPTPNWLESLERAAGADGEAALIGGRVENALPHDPFAAATQALVDFLGDSFNREPGRARLLTSNNLCVAAAPFRELGGFDAAFAGAGGEDREFCVRWLQHGRRAVYCPDAVVHHAHDLTLAGFIRQHYAYGRGAALLRQQALVHGYGPLRFERASFYGQLLRYPLRSGTPAERARTSALFALAQLANAAGYFSMISGKTTLPRRQPVS